MLPEPVNADAALPASLSARLLACLQAAHPVTGLAPALAVDAAREALALALELGDVLDQTRASTWLALHLHRLGLHAQMLVQAREAQALLAAYTHTHTRPHTPPRTFPQTPEHTQSLAADHRELLRTVTISASETGAFDVALDAAHELVRLATAAGGPGPALAAAFGLAVCFERMGDSWQAVRLLGAALSQYGHEVPDTNLLMALNGLCAIAIGVYHRLVGAAPEADVLDVLARGHAAGVQARALLAQVPDVVYEVAITGNLGEILLYRQQHAEAETLLRDALAMAQQRGLVAGSWRVRATWGAWLLADGQAAEALASMQQLLAEMGSAAPQQTTVRAHHVAYLACRTLGDPAQALTHLEVVERTERQRAISQLRAQSTLFVTRTEAQHAQWQADQARQDAQAQRERAAEFAADAERDPLTGLGNRRHLDRRCAELLPAAARDSLPLSLALLDIDHFKQVNDRHGHAVGDQVLVLVSQLLRENTRAGDVLARHGGKEFVIVLPGLGSERAAEVCERLRKSVAASAFAEQGLPRGAITVSIGLASAGSYHLQGLLHAADKALYRAKREGRNRLALGGR